jgi:two-component system sensor histidine kinase BaeS
MRELRWLTEAFNSMAAHLETDERQRRSLLADVSHELRTPLAVLRGELEAMIDGVHPIDEAHLTAAVDQIAMLTKLVEDLRTLPWPKAGRSRSTRSRPTWRSWPGAAASFEAWRHGRVRLEVEMPDDLPLVDLDPLRIQQVIGNLVANALRYAPRAAPSRSPGRPGRGAVTISVTDTARASPRGAAALFERFAKSEDSRGSGLGLAIARRWSRPTADRSGRAPAGGGTTIAFDLPT